MVRSIELTIDYKDAYIPAVPPPGGAPARTAPTTQVLVSVPAWPGNVFRLWAPENVGRLWRNWDQDRAHQEFAQNPSGSLLWRLEYPSGWAIETEVAPAGGLLSLETRVTNGTGGDLPDVSATNCVQFKLAPDFACDDFSRIYIRTDGHWSSLASLSPASDYPHYVHANVAGHDGTVGWGADLSHLFEPVKADDPLMVCVSRDGRRSVATASEDCEYLFHNRANEELLCIHSTQSGVKKLARGETAVFRQRVYFVEGGIEECVRAFGSDAGAVRSSAMI